MTPRNQSLVTLATPETIDTVAFGILSHLEAAYQRLQATGDQEAAAWIDNAAWEVQQLAQYVVDAKDIIRLAIETSRAQREEAVLAATVAADQRDQETALKNKALDDLAELRLAIWSQQAARAEEATGIREDLITTVTRLTKVNRFEVECFVDDLLAGHLSSPEAETVTLALAKWIGG